MLLANPETATAGNRKGSLTIITPLRRSAGPWLTRDRREEPQKLERKRNLPPRWRRLRRSCDIDAPIGSDAFKWY
jgi:hypothetical protein